MCIQLFIIIRKILIQNHRIREYPELGGTQKDHCIQLPDRNSTVPKTVPCARVHCPKAS